jgi:RimJ/RimL family protein N-acetyltransferase
VSADHELVTSRLVLRPPDPRTDLDEAFAIFSDPALWTHAPESRHRTAEQTHNWLVRAAVNWDRYGMSYWIARLRTDETMVGAGGVGRQPTGAWNVFYRLATDFHGQGLATEIARAGLAHAAELDPDVPCIAWIRSDNAASRRVAERLGLVDGGLRVDPADGVQRVAYADRPLSGYYGALVPDSGRPDADAEGDADAESDGDSPPA